MITSTHARLHAGRQAALYKAFSPEEARRLARRLEIHYTPKHGSCLHAADTGLNIAEIEMSVLSNQCLPVCVHLSAVPNTAQAGVFRTGRKDRIPAIESLKEQVSAWTNDRNNKSKAVNWQFTTEDARVKLKKLYLDDEALEPSMGSSVEVVIRLFWFILDSSDTSCKGEAA